MAADAWKVYDSMKEFIGDNTIDLDQGDAYFTVLLVASSYTPNVGTHTAYSDVSTPELSTANGYTVGGDICTSVTWTESAGTVTFDSANPTWTASGGSITARYAVLCHIAAGSGTPVAGDKLLAYCLMDNSPADVTAADGADLTINLSANGYFQLTGGGS